MVVDRFNDVKMMISEISATKTSVACEPERNIRHIYFHEGNEYILVKDWSDNELLGYREATNGHIEIITSFVGSVTLTKILPAFMKLVLDFRGEQINGGYQGNNQGR